MVLRSSKDERRTPGGDPLLKGGEDHSPDSGSRHAPNADDTSRARRRFLNWLRVRVVCTPLRVVLAVAIAGLVLSTLFLSRRSSLVPVKLNSASTQPQLSSEAGENPCFEHLHHNRTQVVGKWYLNSQTHAPLPCTMQTCFDHLRCSSSLPPARIKVYIYPKGPKTKGGTDFYFRHMVDFILRDSYFEVVERPEDACLLVPRFDTVCAYNDCDGHLISKQLRQLPYWNNGRNHVLLHITDPVLPLFDSGEAILIHASGAAFTHRYNFDVQLSLYKPDMHRLHDKPSVEKDLLLTFMGRVYPDCANDSKGQFTSARRHIVRHLNQPDRGSYLNYQCYDFRSRHRYTGVDCSGGGDKKMPTNDFVQGLLRSKFALAPAGMGPHSYRFIEALSAGAIPVVVGDELLLPFPEEITPERWAQCVLHVPEMELAGLLDVLGNVTAAQLEGLRRRCAGLYREYFISDDVQMRAAYRQIRSRIWTHGITDAATKLDALVLHTWWEQVSPSDYQRALLDLGLESAVFGWGSFKKDPSPADYQLPATIDASIAEFRWRGYNLWSIAKFDIAVYSKKTIGQLLHDPEALKRSAGVIREQLGLAARYVDAGERLMALHRPSAVFLTQGCNLPSNAWSKVAIAKGIRTIVTENTLHKDRLIWDHSSGCSVISGDVMSMFFRYRDTVPLAEVQKHTQVYFSDIQRTKQGEHSTNTARKFEPWPSGKTIVFLGQVFTDCSVIGGLHPAFSSPADVIAALIQHALTAPDINLVLKLHPKECGKWDIVANLTKNHMQTHPSGDLLAAVERSNNIRIDACKEFSTYDVLGAADVVVTITSQAGLEAAAMGKPVVLAGRSFYSGAGFTRDAQDAEDLVHSVGRALSESPEVAAQRKLVAETFLYVYLWKAGIERSGKAIAALFKI